MGFLDYFQIMKNSKDNCLAGQIFVHFSNVVLWFTMFFMVFVVTFLSDTLHKQYIGSLCLIGMIIDFIFMSSVEAPVLHNPFKRKGQESIQIGAQEKPEKEETFKDDMMEEYNQSVEKASRVNDSDTLDHSLFD